MLRTIFQPRHFLPPLLTCGMLLAMLTGIGCKHDDDLSAMALAKRYPQGEYFFPADVKQELHARMKPREYMAFIAEYRTDVSTLHTPAASQNSSQDEHHKQWLASHRAWKPSTASEFSRNAKGLPLASSDDEFILWRPGVDASPGYTLSIDANDAENLRLYVEITYLHGKKVVTTTFQKLIYDGSGLPKNQGTAFEGMAVFPLAPGSNYDAIRVNAVLRSDESNKRFAKSFALSDAKS